MKLNRIFSKFLLVAAAFMAVACSEDAEVDNAPHIITKPQSPEVTGNPYFKINIDKSQLLSETFDGVSSEVMIVNKGQEVELEDISECCVSHEWSVSEGAVFVVDGVEDNTEILLDSKVMVKFLDEGDHTVTVRNRYSEMTSFEYTPKGGSVQLVNSIQEEGTQYFIMEFVYHFRVYSDSYDASIFSTTLFTDEACTEPAEVVDGYVTLYANSDPLYIKDMSDYGVSQAAPTTYKWSQILDAANMFEVTGIDNKAKISNFDTPDAETQVELAFEMRVSREDNSTDEDMLYLPAIAETGYVSPIKVRIMPLSADPLVIASVEPYDLQNVSTTDQLILTLRQSDDDKATFDGEKLSGMSAADLANLYVNYSNTTKGVTDQKISVESVAIKADDSKSMIITLSDKIYTDDSDLKLVLSSDLDGLDSTNNRPLESFETELLYTAELLPTEMFDFTDFTNPDNITPADLGWWLTNNSGAVASTNTIEFVADPTDPTKTVMKVTMNDTSTNVLVNSYLFNMPEGDYFYEWETYGEVISPATSFNSSVTLYITNSTTYDNVEATRKSASGTEKGGFVKPSIGSWGVISRDTNVANPDLSPCFGGEDRRITVCSNSLVNGIFYVKRVSVRRADYTPRP